MYYLRYSYLLLFICFQSRSALAQESICIGERLTIHSSILGEERVILLSLPATYEHGVSSYPVLYLLDGEYHFQHAVGSVRFLSGIGKMPECIVVGIANVDRERDFTPVPVDYLAVSGGAPLFLQFIEKDLMPFMETNYRCASFRILAGHSLGGEFTLYSLIKKPELFQGYIAMSPVVHYADSYLLELARKDLKARFKTPKFLFMTVGNEQDYLEPLKKFNMLLNERCAAQMSYKYTILSKEQHSTVPYQGLYMGLEHIFEGWEMPEYRLQQGFSAIEAFNAELSSRYGYHVDNIERDINRLGYVYISAFDYERAISIFEENVRRYPDSPNAWDSLGEACERAGDRLRALECYRKALELAIVQNLSARTYLQRKIQYLDAREK